MIVPGSENAESRDAAWLASRHCDLCGGNGMVTVFHPRHSGNAVDAIEHPGSGRVQVVRQCAAHCVCDLGKWIRVRTPVEVQLRIPSVREILDGRSGWRLDDPGMAEFAPGLAPKRWREMLRDVTQPVGGKS